MCKRCFIRNWMRLAGAVLETASYDYVEARKDFLYDPSDENKYMILNCEKFFLIEYKKYYEPVFGCDGFELIKKLREEADREKSRDFE